VWLGERERDISRGQDDPRRLGVETKE
jgi:hypothetical protein